MYCFIQLCGHVSVAFGFLSKMFHNFWFNFFNFIFVRNINDNHDNDNNKLADKNSKNHSESYNLGPLKNSKAKAASVNQANTDQLQAKISCYLLLSQHYGKYGHSVSLLLLFYVFF